MTQRRYDLRLYRQQQPVREATPTQRHLDLDDTQQPGLDRLLTQLLADAVQRAGGDLAELGLYTLRLCRPGMDEPDLTFAAAAFELLDEKGR